MPYTRFSTNSKTSASLGSATNEPTFFVDTGVVGDAGVPPAGWLPYPAFAMDGYGTANASFVGYRGVIEADSKIFAQCSQGAQLTASQSNGTNFSFQKGLEVFFSSTAVTRVTNFAEVNGLTFKEFDCAGTTATKTFNSDNTVTSKAALGTNALPTALFLTQGGVSEDGSKKTGTLFKVSTAIGTEYFLVTFVESNLGRYYTLSYKQ